MDVGLLDQIGGVRTVVAVAAVIIAMVWLRRLLTGSQEPEFAVPGRCKACRWTGSVSKYRPVCPKCGNKLEL